MRLKYNTNGNIPTKVFYCNPNAAQQKGMLKKNHEYISLVIPKGFSIDYYTEEDITKRMNHINNKARDSLNGCNPFKLSLMIFDYILHDVLQLKEITQIRCHCVLN